MLDRIDRILTPLRYTFFSGSPPSKNPRVKLAWPATISRWVTDQQVFPVGLVYDAKVLLGVMTARPMVAGVLQIISEPTLVVSRARTSQLRRIRWCTC
jgi:hypothetical protein